MNNRIKELKIQACKWASENASSAEYENAADQKFAELIVRECAELCEGEAIFAGSNGRKDASASNCSTIIRKHFGVEE
jgi:hypothetical protein